VVTPTPDRTGEARPRRAGRFFALLAGLILIGSGGGAFWLHQTHKLQDFLEQPPAIAVQIPDAAVAPVQAASETTPPASEPTTSVATPETAPAASDAGSGTAIATPPAPAATETMASTETAPASSTEAPATTATTESSAATPPAPAEAPVTTTESATTESATTETTVTETTATPPAAPATTDMAGATEPPAATEMPAASTATAEPAAPAAAEATTAEATAPPPATVAESGASAETAVTAPVIPLPRLKPPLPAAPAPTLSAAAETTTPAAPAATEATPPAPAGAAPGTSLGSAATAEAVTAPATTETQTASTAAPAASNGGEAPWKKNARPFATDDPRPRVSLVVTGLGLTAAQTQAAIDQLPPEITLGFSPYSGELQNWIAKARAAGHEVLIELPMEPLNYPADDPGPEALLANLSPAENLKRLDWVLARSDQMVGLVANMGSRFQANARLIRPILTRVAEKGYLYIDNRSGPTSVISEVASSIDLPWTYNTRFVDAEATRVSIDGRLQQLERTAREKGFALGLAQGYPVTIERVAAWARSLEVKGLVLAPASALAKTGAQ
jgi:hypothetical protein